MVFLFFGTTLKSLKAFYHSFIVLVSTFKQFELDNHKYIRF